MRARHSAEVHTQARPGPSPAERLEKTKAKKTKKNNKQKKNKTRMITNTTCSLFATQHSTEVQTHTRPGHSLSEGLKSKTDKEKS